MIFHHMQVRQYQFVQYKFSNQFATMNFITDLTNPTTTKNSFYKMVGKLSCMFGKLALGELVLANLHWAKDHRPVSECWRQIIYRETSYLKVVVIKGGLLSCLDMISKVNVNGLNICIKNLAIGEMWNRVKTERAHCNT